MENSVQLAFREALRLEKESGKARAASYAQNEVLIMTLSRQTNFPARPASEIVEFFKQFGEIEMEPEPPVEASSGLACPSEMSYGSDNSGATTAAERALEPVVVNQRAHKPTSRPAKVRADIKKSGRGRFKTSDQSNTLRGAQVRAARGLVGWSQDELAEMSGLGLTTIQRFERAGDIVLGARASTLVKLVRSLKDEGVVFLDDDADGGIGVRKK